MTDWKHFTEGVTAVVEKALSGPSGDRILIAEIYDDSHYVQFCADDDGIAFEIASGAYDVVLFEVSEPGAALLDEVGFAGGLEGNHEVQLKLDVGPDHLAALMVRCLREFFGAEDPSQIKLFFGAGEPATV